MVLRVFFEWSANTIIFLFISISIIIIINFRKKFQTDFTKDLSKNNIFVGIMGQLMPVIILFVVTLTGSILIKPIIHFRPLIVIYPSLILIAGLLGNYLFRNNQYKILQLTFLIFLTFININFYFKNIINTVQNIEWVVDKTFTKNCKDNDVYFNDDGKNIFNYVNKIVEIYSENLRPIKSLSDFKVNNLDNENNLNKDCKVLVFSFHTYNLEKI